jgi:hypothetical protein
MNFGALNPFQKLVRSSQHFVSISTLSDFCSADEDITVNEPIEPDTPFTEIRPEPYTLPQGFVWDTLSLDNPQTVTKRIKKLFLRLVYIYLSSIL